MSKLRQLCGDHAVKYALCGKHAQSFGHSLNKFLLVLIAVKYGADGRVARQNALAGDLLIEAYRVFGIGYLYFKGTVKTKIDRRIIFGIKIRNGRACSETYPRKLLQIDVNNALFIGRRAAVSKTLYKILGGVLYLSGKNRGSRGIVQRVAAGFGNDICNFTVIESKHTGIFLYHNNAAVADNVFRSLCITCSGGILIHLCACAKNDTVAHSTAVYGFLPGVAECSSDCSDCCFNKSHLSTDPFDFLLL